MGPVQMSTGDDTSLPPNQYTDQKFYSTDCHTWTYVGYLEVLHPLRTSRTSRA